MGAACITGGGLGHFKRKVFPASNRPREAQQQTFQEVDVDMSMWHGSSPDLGQLRGILRGNSHASLRGGAPSLFWDTEGSNASPQAPPGPASTPGIGSSLQAAEAPPSSALGVHSTEDVIAPQGAASSSPALARGRDENKQPSIWGRRRGRSWATRPHPTINTGLS